MYITVISAVLLLLAPIASAAMVWGPIGQDPNVLVEGSGDTMTRGGASVLLSASAIGPQGFAGAIAALDAIAFRGRDLELSGVLEVTEGSGPAALWIRADGPGGTLAFLNTQARPVRTADGNASRAIRLYVPLAATTLKIGTLLEAVGTVEARSVRLSVLPLAPVRSNAHEVLRAAMDAIQTSALHADRVDWRAERSRLLTAELKVRPAQEAHVSINRLLKSLGDRHSFLQPSTGALSHRDTAGAAQPISTRVFDGVGYLLVPGFRGADEETGRSYSAELCTALAAGAKTPLNGWMVDLRRNGGGNMWPMIAGLRPLLGDGAIGSFKDRAGKVETWPADRNAACSVDLTASRVAVLVGPVTASSGEAVAVAFKGRKNTTFFGQPSAGLSTANRGIPLPDGSVLMLAVATFVDRDGVEYPGGIEPDFPLPSGEDAIAARKWLQSTSQ